MITRLCVIGLGLIGGSVALAARKGQLAREIVGAEEDPENLRCAISAGVVDRGYGDAATAADGADFILIAVPVGAFPSVFEQLRPVWQSDAIYTDAGSTKSSVAEAARRCFGLVPTNFIPGHPIAGAERSGVGAASAELFAGKRVILTPDTESDPLRVERVRRFWAALGAAEVTEMSAEHHDTVLAATSHLPHILAFSLVHLLGQKDEQQEIFQYAAGGFRDFTRIASSDPAMWRDICLANRQRLLSLIGEFQSDLMDFSALIKDCREAEILDYLVTARSARQRYLTRVES